MRKILFPLMTFLLSFPALAKHKSMESDSTINDHNDNLYLDCMSTSGGNCRQHYSHGSAHHYSAVTYAKNVKFNLVNEVNRSEDELQKINEALSIGHMPSDGRRAVCQVYRISYVDLLSINEMQINRRCYMITFISEYFGEASHSHTYCTYFFTEDDTMYYRTQPYVKSGKINEIEWAAQILKLIK